MAPPRARRPSVPGRKRSKSRHASAKLARGYKTWRMPWSFGEIDAPLSALCRAAENTLRTVIDFAGATGARFPKISATPMSERETEIANLAAMGFSDLNIAQRLHISEGTVGRHLNNIYRGLGLRSRLELTEFLGIGD